MNGKSLMTNGTGNTQVITHNLLQTSGLSVQIRSESKIVLRYGVRRTFCLGGLMQTPLTKPNSTLSLLMRSWSAVLAQMPTIEWTL